MSQAVFIVALVPIILLIALGVPILIGVYVYRDAKSRGMDGLLWTLIAVLTPSFIGLIIYVAMRAQNTVAVCAHCGHSVNPGYAVCPNCGASLKRHCSACGAIVEEGWRVCAQCAAPIAEQGPPLVVRSAPKNNKVLVGILIGIIAIPVLIAIFVIIGLMGFNFYALESGVSAIEGMTETILPQITGLMP